MRASLIFLLILTACQGRERLTPAGKVASAVGDKILATVSLGLTQDTIDHRQEGIYTLYVDGPSSGYEIKSTLSELVPGQYLALAANTGTIVVRFNGKVVITGATQTKVIPERLDYELVQFEYREKLDSDQGELEIEYRPANKGLSAVFVWITDEHGTIIKKCRLETTHNQKEAVYVYRPVGSKPWQEPIKMTTPVLTAPLDMADWRYFTGIYLDALWQAGDHFERTDYRSFVNRYMDFLGQELPQVAYERKEKKLLESAFGHYFRYQLLDDFGTQTLIFLRDTGNNDHQKYVDKALKHIQSSALRLTDSTFCRHTPDSSTVWADDLFMGMALLSRAYSQNKAEHYLEEAIHQTLRFDHYLKDDKTGLYWHGYFDHTKKNSSSKWARANGWTMMAKTELLLAIPPGHEKRAAILEIFRSHAQALKEYQSGDGRWHQVLDNPSTYLETSSTAMFTRAFAEGILNGWLDDSFMTPTVKAWKALTQQIDSAGNVAGIVKGTPILFSDEAYDRQKTRLNDPRGLGAVLYAAMAMDKLLAKHPTLLEMGPQAL